MFFCFWVGVGDGEGAGLAARGAGVGVRSRGEGEYVRRSLAGVWKKEKRKADSEGSFSVPPALEGTRTREERATNQQKIRDATTSKGKELVGWENEPPLEASQYVFSFLFPLLGFFLFDEFCLCV